jgi:hypothetical protein
MNWFHAAVTRQNEKNTKIGRPKKKKKIVPRVGHINKWQSPQWQKEKRDLENRREVWE